MRSEQIFIDLELKANKELHVVCPKTIFFLHFWGTWDSPNAQICFALFCVY